MVEGRTRRLCASLAILLLAGCTVGPNYKLPRTAMINNPAAQANFLADNTATQIANPPDNWWHLYDDPTLDALVQRAFAANTNLRVAQANLESAYALLAAAKAGREASVTTSDSTDYGQRSAQAVLSKIPAAQLERYNVGITVSYDADLFGGIRRGIEAANDDSQAAEDARDLVKVSVAAETTRAYADICDDGNQLAALRHAIALQNQSLAFVRLLHENGRATSFDVAGAQAQLETLQSKLPPLQAAQTNAAYRLAALMGEPPESYDPTWLACQQPLVLHTLLPVGDGKSLLNRRPDVREAERRLAAATARVGQAEAKLYPDFKLGGAVGSTGAAFDAFAPVTNLFNLGPSVSWDLNQSAIRAHIAQAKAQVQARQAAFDGTVLAALQEAQSAITSYESELDQAASVTDARNFAAQVAADMTALHQGGRVNALMQLGADQKLAAANIDVANLQTKISDSQIALFYALGGGWGNTNLASASTSPGQPQ
ncbi:MAG: efflux transporter outer membrane subunit [Proteobacteria bacterium]|nr:efflux transporter outer membrane subunit [Pseudomonadota bacterium]